MGFGRASGSERGLALSEAPSTRARLRITPGRERGEGRRVPRLALGLLQNSCTAPAGSLCSNRHTEANCLRCCGVRPAVSAARLESMVGLRMGQVPTR